MVLSFIFYWLVYGSADPIFLFFSSEHQRLIFVAHGSASGTLKVGGNAIRSMNMFCIQNDVD